MSVPPSDKKNSTASQLEDSGSHSDQQQFSEPLVPQSPKNDRLGVQTEEKLDLAAHFLSADTSRLPIKNSTKDSASTMQASSTSMTILNNPGEQMIRQLQLPQDDKKYHSIKGTTFRENVLETDKSIKRGRVKSLQFKQDEYQAEEKCVGFSKLLQRQKIQIEKQRKIDGHIQHSDEDQVNQDDLPIDLQDRIFKGRKAYFQKRRSRNAERNLDSQDSTLLEQFDRTLKTQKLKQKILAKQKQRQQIRPLFEQIQEETYQESVEILHSQGLQPPLFDGAVVPERHQDFSFSQHHIMNHPSLNNNVLYVADAPSRIYQIPQPHQSEAASEPLLEMGLPLQLRPSSRPSSAIMLNNHKIVNPHHLQSYRLQSRSRPMQHITFQDRLPAYTNIHEPSVVRPAKFFPVKVPTSRVNNFSSPSSLSIQEMRPQSMPGRSLYPCYLKSHIPQPNPYLINPQVTFPKSESQNQNYRENPLREAQSIPIRITRVQVIAKPADIHNAQIPLVVPSNTCNNRRDSPLSSFLAPAYGRDYFLQQKLSGPAIRPYQNNQTEYLRALRDAQVIPQTSQVGLSRQMLNLQSLPLTQAYPHPRSTIPFTSSIIQHFPQDGRRPM